MTLAPSRPNQDQDSRPELLMLVQRHGTPSTASPSVDVLSRYLQRAAT
jgi:hypothetical protein